MFEKFRLPIATGSFSARFVLLEVLNYVVAHCGEASSRWEELGYPKKTGVNSLVETAVFDKIRVFSGSKMEDR